MSNNKVHNFSTLMLIQASNIATIPVAVLGFILTTKYGISNAIVSIVFGNLILTLLAIPIGIRSTNQRISTIEEVRFILGKTGTIIASLGLIILLSGWFAVNVGFIKEALSYIISKDYQIILNIVLGSIIILTVINDIEALRKFARYSAPLFTITILIALYHSFDTSKITDLHIYKGSITIDALMLVIASPFAMIFDLPTFYRFSVSKKDSIISLLLVFIFCMTCIETIGALLAEFTREKTIFAVLVQNQTGGLLIWNVIFIALSGLAINNCNLYVSAANSTMILPKFSFKRSVICIGIVATALSYIDVLKYFDKLLQGMMIIIASITILMVVNGLYKQTKFHQKIAIISVIFGTLIGFASFIGIIKLCGYAYFEASITTVCVYLLFQAGFNIKHKFKS